MNKNQLDNLRGIEARPILHTVDDLTNKEPRTLLYGYDVDRYTWHTYLGFDLKIKLVKYRGPHDCSKVDLIPCFPKSSEDFVPNKRLNPERCDFEFCALLKRAGIHLCFTKYIVRAEDTHARFYGCRL